jgi:hypothetical protein
MQTKTIQKNIRAKMLEWLNTIKDETLRGKINKSLLVSGGCITSMLLGEPVNDYDVYLSDIEVLHQLALYYAKGYTEIRVLDGRQKEKLEETLKDEYESDNAVDMHNAYAISLRNLKPDQIKLFFEAKNGGLRVNEDKKPEALNYSPIFFSPNAISLSNNLQIVLRFHGTPDEIHETFDFVHPTNYFTMDGGIVTNKEALESIITKQLRYQGSFYPVTSIIRMKKFVKRGWNINAGEILKIAFQISELDLHNPDVLEEQLIGVDVAYFSVLIGILRGIDPSKLTSAYLNAIIDKVFNEEQETE